MSIKMQYPNIEGNRLCDGKIHDIRPDNLARFNYNGEELYLLSYYDYSINCSCNTILSRDNNGVFYKNPLSNYNNLQSIISSVKLFKIPVHRLGTKIELGKMRDGNLSVLDEKTVSVGGGVPPIPPQAASSGPGGPPPTTPPSFFGGGGGGVPPTPPQAASGGGVPPIPPHNDDIVINNDKRILNIYINSGLKSRVFAVDISLCNTFGEKFYNDICINLLPNPNFEVIKFDDRLIKVVYIPYSFIKSMEEDKISPIEPHYVHNSGLTLNRSIDVYTNADQSLYAVPRCVYDAYFSGENLSYFGKGIARDKLVVFYIKKLDLDRVVKENRLFVTLHPLLSDKLSNNTSLTGQEDVQFKDHNDVNTTNKNSFGSVEPQPSSVVSPVEVHSSKNDTNSELRKVISSKAIENVSIYYNIFNRLEDTYLAIKNNSSESVVSVKFLSLEVYMNLNNVSINNYTSEDTYTAKIQYYVRMMHRSLKAKNLEMYERIKNEYTDFELNHKNGKSL